MKTKNEFASRLKTRMKTFAKRESQFSDDDEL